MKERIKKIRKEYKMTQVEFGEKIGVKGNTITNYENGMRNPTDAVILSICREFNINEDWLRYGKEPMKKEADIDISRILAEIGVNDPKACEAIKKYFQLSDEDKNLFWDFVERFMK